MGSATEAGWRTGLSLTSTRTVTLRTVIVQLGLAVRVSLNRPENVPAADARGGEVVAAPWARSGFPVPQPGRRARAAARTAGRCFRLTICPLLRGGRPIPVGDRAPDASRDGSRLLAPEGGSGTRRCPAWAGSGGRPAEARAEGPGSREPGPGRHRSPPLPGASGSGPRRGWKTRRGPRRKSRPPGAWAPPAGRAAAR